MLHVCETNYDFSKYNMPKDYNTISLLVCMGLSHIRFTSDSLVYVYKRYMYMYMYMYKVIKLYWHVSLYNYTCIIVGQTNMSVLITL